MPSIRDDDFDPAECIADEFDLEDFAPPSPPASLSQELLQSVAASTPPIIAAAPSNAALRSEMNTAKTSVQNRIKDLMQSDPILSKFKNKNYGIQVNATPYMKAKEGTSKVFEAIIDHILTQSGAVQKQTEIRNYVAERYPSHSIPKDWTKPLPLWAIKKVKERIRNSAAPISNIQLPKAVTLSQLHKAAAAAMERHKTGVQTFRPVVEVSDTSIVINGTAFSIGENKVKGRVYRQVRVSMSELLQALIA
ncbi:MAG TPA: hypothetical protein PKD55_15995 [Bellilinea sp.]|nr:hypothetical protein [Bellilinea sp.]